MKSERRGSADDSKAGGMLRLVEGPASATGPEGVIERVRLAVAGISFVEIARRTGIPADTVRRQIALGRPSLTLLGSLCEKFDISPDWLLTGRGPREYSAVGAHFVRTAEPGELLGEVGRQLQSVKAAVAVLCETKPSPSDAPTSPGAGDRMQRRARRALPRTGTEGIPRLSDATDVVDGSWPRLQRLPFLEAPAPGPRTRRQAGPREGRA